MTLQVSSSQSLVLAQQDVAQQLILLNGWVSAAGRNAGLPEPEGPRDPDR
jgi:hypothetical protein